jgi:hypothetical protein
MKRIIFTMLAAGTLGLAAPSVAHSIRAIAQVNQDNGAPAQGVSPENNSTPQMQQENGAAPQMQEEKGPATEGAGSQENDSSPKEMTPENQQNESAGDEPDSEQK